MCAQISYASILTLANGDSIIKIADLFFASLTSWGEVCPVDHRSPLIVAGFGSGTLCPAESL